MLTGGSIGCGWPFSIFIGICGIWKADGRLFDRSIGCWLLQLSLTNGSASLAGGDGDDIFGLMLNSRASDSGPGTSSVRLRFRSKCISEIIHNKLVLVQSIAKFIF